MASLRAWVVGGPINEAPYLLEWLAHYLELGFAGAILITGNSEDGTAAMADRLQEMGLVHHIPLAPKPGTALLRQGLEKLKPTLAELNADWAMLADCSEFLVIRTEGSQSLSDLIAATAAQRAISVCRKPFGYDGSRGIPESPILGRYMEAEPEEDHGSQMARGIKTLFRPEMIDRISVHRPFFAENEDLSGWVDAGGQPMPERYRDACWFAHPNFSHSFARLHYYSTPTPEAFVIRNGGAADAETRAKLASIWEQLNKTGQRDPAILHYAAGSAARLNDLRSDERLAALEKAGLIWHTQKARELLEDATTKSFCDELAKLTPKDGEKRRSSPRSGGGTYIPPPIRPIRFEIRPSPTGECHAVLHAGFHKTATTFLQRMLESNEKWLGKKSIYVVPHQKLRKHITFPSQLDAYRKLDIHRRTQFSEEELAGFSKAFFAEPLANRPARTILSDENIAGLPAHCVTSGTLYRHRKMFLSCFAQRIPLPIQEVFVAVRGYADFFASSYVEYLRSATPRTQAQILSPQEMRRLVLSNLVSWETVLRDLQAAFPQARLRVWRYEEFRELSPRVLEALCGPKINVSKLVPPEAKRVRSSASARAVQEMVLLAQSKGAGAMAEQSRSIQERFPLGPDYGRFDPWTTEERAHLEELYARDWEAIRGLEQVDLIEAVSGKQ